MQLTLHTDYALRVLIFLQAHDGRPTTVGEIATSFRISHHHLTKVVQRLVGLGYVQSTRGRGGGLRLALPAEAINVGQVVRQVEPNLDFAECFNHDQNSCPLAFACYLKRVLYEGRAAFLNVLDAYHLPDITRQQKTLRRLLQTDDDAT